MKFNLFNLFKKKFFFSSEKKIDDEKKNNNKYNDDESFYGSNMNRASIFYTISKFTKWVSHNIAINRIIVLIFVLAFFLLSKILSWAITLFIYFPLRIMKNLFITFFNQIFELFCNFLKFLFFQITIRKLAVLFLLICISYFMKYPINKTIDLNWYMSNEFPIFYYNWTLYVGGDSFISNISQLTKSKDYFFQFRDSAAIEFLKLEKKVSFSKTSPFVMYYTHMPEPDLAIEPWQTSSPEKVFLIKHWTDWAINMDSLDYWVLRKSYAKGWLPYDEIIEILLDTKKNVNLVLKFLKQTQFFINFFIFEKFPADGLLVLVKYKIIHYISTLDNFFVVNFSVFQILIFNFQKILLEFFLSISDKLLLNVIVVCKLFLASFFNMIFDELCGIFFRYTHYFDWNTKTVDAFFPIKDNQNFERVFDKEREYESIDKSNLNSILKVKQAFQNPLTRGADVKNFNIEQNEYLDYVLDFARDCPPHVRSTNAMRIRLPLPFFKTDVFTNYYAYTPGLHQRRLRGALPEYMRSLLSVFYSDFNKKVISSRLIPRPFDELRASKIFTLFLDRADQIYPDENWFDFFFENIEKEGFKPQRQLSYFFKLYQSLGNYDNVFFPDRNFLNGHHWFHFNYSEEEEDEDEYMWRGNFDVEEKAFKEYTSLRSLKNLGLNELDRGKESDAARLFYDPMNGRTWKRYYKFYVVHYQLVRFIVKIGLNFLAMFNLIKYYTITDFYLGFSVYIGVILMCFLFKAVFLEVKFLLSMLLRHKLKTFDYIFLKKKSNNFFLISFLSFLTIFIYLGFVFFLRILRTLVRLVVFVLYSLLRNFFKKLVILINRRNIGSFCLSIFQTVYIFFKKSSLLLIRGNVVIYHFLKNFLNIKTWILFFIFVFNFIWVRLRVLVMSILKLMFWFLILYFYLTVFFFLLMYKIDHEIFNRVFFMNNNDLNSWSLGKLGIINTINHIFKEPYIFGLEDTFLGTFFLIGLIFLFFFLFSMFSTKFNDECLRSPYLQSQAQLFQDRVGSYRYENVNSDDFDSDLEDFFFEGNFFGFLDEDIDSAETKYDFFLEEAFLGDGYDYGDFSFTDNLSANTVQEFDTIQEMNSLRLYISIYLLKENYKNYKSSYLFSLLKNLFLLRRIFFLSYINNSFSSKRRKKSLYKKLKKRVLSLNNITLNNSLKKSVSVGSFLASIKKKSHYKKKNLQMNLFFILVYRETKTFFDFLLIKDKKYDEKSIFFKSPFDSDTFGTEEPFNEGDWSWVSFEPKKSIWRRGNNRIALVDYLDFIFGYENEMVEDLSYFDDELPIHNNFQMWNFLFDEHDYDFYDHDFYGTDDFYSSSKRPFDSNFPSHTFKNELMGNAPYLPEMVENFVFQNDIPYIKDSFDKMHYSATTRAFYKFKSEPIDMMERFRTNRIFFFRYWELVIDRLQDRLNYLITTHENVKIPLIGLNLKKLKKGRRKKLIVLLLLRMIFFLKKQSLKKISPIFYLNFLYYFFFSNLKKKNSKKLFKRMDKNFVLVENLFINFFKTFLNKITYTHKFKKKKKLKKLDKKQALLLKNKFSKKKLVIKSNKNILLINNKFKKVKKLKLKKIKSAEKKKFIRFLKIIYLYYLKHLSTMNSYKISKKLDLNWKLSRRSSKLLLKSLRNQAKIFLRQRFRKDMKNSLKKDKTNIYNFFFQVDNNIDNLPIYTNVLSTTSKWVSIASRWKYPKTQYSVRLSRFFSIYNKQLLERKAFLGEDFLTLWNRYSTRASWAYGFFFQTEDELDDDSLFDSEEDFPDHVLLDFEDNEGFLYEDMDVEDFLYNPYNEEHDFSEKFLDKIEEDFIYPSTDTNVFSPFEYISYLESFDYEDGMFNKKQLWINEVFVDRFVFDVLGDNTLFEYDKLLLANISKLMYSYKFSDDNILTARSEFVKTFFVDFFNNMPRHYMRRLNRYFWFRVSYPFLSQFSENSMFPGFRLSRFSYIYNLFSGYQWSLHKNYSLRSDDRDIFNNLFLRNFAVIFYNPYNSNFLLEISNLLKIHTISFQASEAQMNRYKREFFKNTELYINLLNLQNYPQLSLEEAERVWAFLGCTKKEWDTCDIGEIRSVLPYNNWDFPLVFFFILLMSFRRSGDQLWSVYTHKVRVANFKDLETYMGKGPVHFNAPRGKKFHRGLKYENPMDLDFWDFSVLYFKVLKPLAQFIYNIFYDFVYFCRFLSEFRLKEDLYKLKFKNDLSIYMQKKHNIFYDFVYFCRSLLKFRLKGDSPIYINLQNKLEFFFFSIHSTETTKILVSIVSFFLLNVKLIFNSYSDLMIIFYLDIFSYLYTIDIIWFIKIFVFFFFKFFHYFFAGFFNVVLFFLSFDFNIIFISLKLIVNFLFSLNWYFFIKNWMYVFFYNGCSLFQVSLFYIFFVSKVFIFSFLFIFYMFFTIDFLCFVYYFFLIKFLFLYKLFLFLFFWF